MLQPHGQMTEATRDLVLTLIFKDTIPTKCGGPVSVSESISNHYFFLGYGVKGRMELLKEKEHFFSLSQNFMVKRIQIFRFLSM